MMSDGVVPNELTMMNVISPWCSLFDEILNCRLSHALASKLLDEGLTTQDHLDENVWVSSNLTKVMGSNPAFRMQLRAVDTRFIPKKDEGLACVQGPQPNPFFWA